MVEGEDTFSDDVSSQHANSVGFVKREHRWSSESSNDYMVMEIRRKRETLLKVVRRTGIDLKQNNTEDDEFRDYTNTRINFLGKMGL